MLPPNSTSTERALSETTARLSNVPVHLRDAWNPDTCPAKLLPWLAWQYSVDEWDASWTDAQKRETIRRSVAVHRYKGTIGAVRNALEGIASNVRIQEWFKRDPAGDPYTFRLLLETDQVGIEQAGYIALLNILERTKNLRSHLEEIVPSVRTQAESHFAGYGLIGSEITVHYEPKAVVINNAVIVAG